MLRQFLILKKTVTNLIAFCCLFVEKHKQVDTTYYEKEEKNHRGKLARAIFKVGISRDPTKCPPNLKMLVVILHSNT